MEILVNNKGNVVLKETCENIEYPYFSPVDDENYYGIELSTSENPLRDLSNTIFEYNCSNEIITDTEYGRINIRKDGDNSINDGYFFVNDNLMSIQNQIGEIGYNNLINCLYNILLDSYVNDQN